MSSSCVKCETIVSNEDWKAAGGKTKRGKPTGRRELAEKYKVNGAVGLDDLCENRRKLRIENRVLGYGFNRYAPFIPPMLAKERRRANKLALQDQLLSIQEAGAE